MEALCNSVGPEGTRCTLAPHDSGFHEGRLLNDPDRPLRMWSFSWSERRNRDTWKS